MPVLRGEQAIKARYIGYGSLGLGGHDEYRVVCKECRASSDEYKSEAKAIAAWNRRAEPELTRCEKCDYWDKSASFMSTHACAFWSSGKKKRDTQKTMNFVH